MRIAAFVFTFAVLTLVPIAIKGIPFVGDAFVEDSPEVFQRMTVLPGYDIAAMKVRHAASQPRYDVGVFGNSRVLSVQAEDLQIGDRSFFNFAVPGTSLRQSLALIENLAAQGKAPRLAIISFDNLEIGYFANAYFPGSFGRWRRAAGDALWALNNRPGDINLLAHMLTDHLSDEWAAFTGTWNADIFWARAAVFAPGLVPPAAPAYIYYTRDGSVAGSVADENPIEPFQRPAQRLLLLPPYMAHDFERLGALDDDVTKILIYESHIDAASQALADANPDAAVEADRSEFRAACDRFGITCYRASELPLPATTARWKDCCHPPRSALGELLSTLVQQHAAL